MFEGWAAEAIFHRRQVWLVRWERSTADVAEADFDISDLQGKPMGLTDHRFDALGSLIAQALAKTETFFDV